jgi:DNA (cytosine-5)-methyltransferase 1
VRLSILKAADYGDPQNRRRVFLFCARTSSGVPLPANPSPTHGPDNVVTARDALKSLESVIPAPGSGMVLVAKDPTAADDESAAAYRVVSHHNSESTEIKAESQKLKADEPANTLLRRNGVEHYSLPRGLTIRERARLQSFPDDYQFCGSLAERSNQIGNAVPINLASAVAQTLYASHTSINHFEQDVVEEEQSHGYDLEDDDWEWYKNQC